MRLTPLLVFSTALLFAMPSLAADEDAPGYPAQADYETIFADLDAAAATARAEEKLLMVVMGADWCHDSRAFLRHLADPAMQKLLASRYTVQLVNVGYYDHVRDVVAKWNVPIIYGTPTVLIIEPQSDTVLNRDSLAFWRNAASLSAEDGMDYFDDWAPGPAPRPETPSPALAEALAAIDRFEREQAERIYLGYAELGEQMREMGDERPSSGFMRSWDNLAAVRSQITVDLARLRSTARDEAVAGVDPISLDWPSYDLFVD